MNPEETIELIKSLLDKGVTTEEANEFEEERLKPCCDANPLCTLVNMCSSLWGDVGEYAPARYKDSPTRSYGNEDTWITQVNLPTLLKQSVYSIASRREL